MASSAPISPVPFVITVLIVLAAGFISGAVYKLMVSNKAHAERLASQTFGVPVQFGQLVRSPEEDAWHFYDVMLTAPSGFDAVPYTLQIPEIIFYSAAEQGPGLVPVFDRVHIPVADLYLEVQRPATSLVMQRAAFDRKADVKYHSRPGRAARRTRIDLIAFDRINLHIFNSAAATSGSATSTMITLDPLHLDNFNRAHGTLLSGGMVEVYDELARHALLAAARQGQLGGISPENAEAINQLIGTGKTMQDRLREPVLDAMRQLGLFLELR